MEGVGAAGGYLWLPLHLITPASLQNEASADAGDMVGAAQGVVFVETGSGAENWPGPQLIQISVLIMMVCPSLIIAHWPL